MALSDQANRLLRRDFDDPLLAQELYTMLLTDTGETTGALSVHLTRLNGAVSFTAPAVETLGIQAVDLDGATSVEIVRESSVARTEIAGTGALKRTNRPYENRSMILGKVISFQSGSGTYTVDLYPHGTDGTALRVIGVVPLTEPSGAGATIPNNTWLLVFRITQAQAVTKEFFDPTGLAVSKVTTVESLVEKHYVINPEVVVTGDLALPGHLTLVTDRRIFFRDSAISISSDADGLLRLEADTAVRLAIGGSEFISMTAATTTISNTLVSSGELKHTGSTAGFYNVTPVTRQTTAAGPGLTPPGTATDFPSAAAADTTLMGNDVAIWNWVKDIRDALRAVGIIN